MSQNENGDPILRGKGISVQQPQALPSEIPAYFNAIPNRTIEVVLAYLKLAWSLKKDSSKEIPFGSLIENTRYLFSDEGKYKDKLWVEHTATNLRELFQDLKFPDDYQRALMNISEDEIQKGGLFSQIITIKSFLDIIVHYRWSLAREKALEITRSSQGSLDDVDIPEIHEKVCILLMLTFYELFSKYAFKEDEKS